jgi:hypothetical protein
VTNGVIFTVSLMMSGGMTMTNGVIFTVSLMSGVMTMMI